MHARLQMSNLVYWSMFMAGDLHGKEEKKCNRCKQVFKQDSVVMAITGKNGKELVCRSCHNDHYSKHE